VNSRAVVVTGMGVVSAIGCGLSSYEAMLRACRTGIATARRDGPPVPDGDVPSQMLPMAMVHEDICSDEAHWLDPFARYGLHAACEALNDAGGADALPGFSERTAIVIGSGNGGDQAREEAWNRVLRGARPHPLTIVRVMVSAASSAISMRLGIVGPCLTVSTACASSTQAIGQAFHMIQRGDVDYALAGGAEELPGFTQLRSWQQMHALSPVACQPFGKDRSGFTLGEGAAVLLLEERSHALARGARVYAELAGFSMGSDAGDWLKANPEGLLRCMRSAMQDAHTHPEDLGYINAHATGTPLGDAAEAEALQQLVGDIPVPVSSTKALHGHAIGASGALGVVASILALFGRWLPAMPAYPRDEQLRLNLIFDHGSPPAQMNGAAVLCNAFGFGGLNSALVFRSHKT
jgi:nodulation protein E